MARSKTAMSRFIAAAKSSAYLARTQIWRRRGGMAAAEAAQSSQTEGTFHSREGIDDRSSSGNEHSPAPQQLAVLKEELAYDRYLQVWDREVQMPNGAVAKFDVVGHKRSNKTFCIVVPFHSETREVTIIEEWAQGPNASLIGFPTGGFDSKKHKSVLECAKAELSEEARLKNGTWIDLLPKDHCGMAEGKWIANRFFCYLVVDPEHDSQPLPRDIEELICTKRVSLDTLFSLVTRGDDMHPCSVRALMMALRELSVRNLVDCASLFQK